MSSPDRNIAADEQLDSIIDTSPNPADPSLSSGPPVPDADPREEFDETPADDADIAEERIEAFADMQGEAAVDATPFPEEERERRRQHARGMLERRQQGLDGEPSS